MKFECGITVVAQLHMSPLQQAKGSHDNPMLHEMPTYTTTTTACHQTLSGLLYIHHGLLLTMTSHPLHYKMSCLMTDLNGNYEKQC